MGPVVCSAVDRRTPRQVRCKHHLDALQRFVVAWTRPASANHDVRMVRVGEETSLDFIAKDFSCNRPWSMKCKNNGNSRPALLVSKHRYPLKPAPEACVFPDKRQSNRIFLCGVPSADVDFVASFIGTIDLANSE